MIRKILLTIAVLLAAADPSTAAHVGICSGVGVLTIPASSHLESEETPKKIPLYELPGVKRATEIDPRHLPPSCPLAVTPSGEHAATVTERKGTWLRIIYDDAGRRGWIRNRRQWQFESWEKVLLGTSASLSPNRKPSSYKVLSLPSDEASAAGAVSPGEEFIIYQVEGDWIRVVAGRISGWLRWRDREGRNLIFRSPAEYKS